MRTTSTATGPPADNEQVDTHPSQSKPSRRAQIFDKGVDALTMQVQYHGGCMAKTSAF